MQYDAKISKEDLQALAYKENAVGRWEELHPEKKKKPRPVGGGGGSNPYADMKAPEGMDPDEWARLMGHMRGDFSAEKDPERRRILEKMQRSGMSMGGASASLDPSTSELPRPACHLAALAPG